MKILMTGASGFIGSRLAKKLAAEGHRVEAIVRKESRVEGITTRFYDGSLSGMETIFSETKPEAVIHLASHFVAEHAPADIDLLVRGNLLFPLHLLEAMSRNGVSSLLTAASFWQHYGNASYSPASLYAATKQAFEDILLFYVEAKKMRALVLTLYDTYGPFDPRPKLFNQLRQAAAEGRMLPMSKGEQKLDLVYIDDCVEGLCLALNRLSSSKPSVLEKFALASGVTLPLKEVVAVYEKVSGRIVPVAWGARPYRVREMMEPYVLEPILPGWKPRTSLLGGLRKMEGEK